MDVSCMAPVQPEIWGRAEWPLGAHLTEDGATFAVYAPDATRVQLEFFPNALGADSAASYPMTKGADGVWRAHISGVFEFDLYGFRAWGPNWSWDPVWVPGSSVGFVTDIDERGNRFNPNKVLFDPYALEITHNVYSVHTPPEPSSTASPVMASNANTHSPPTATHTCAFQSKCGKLAAYTAPIRNQSDTQQAKAIIPQAEILV